VLRDTTLRRWLALLDFLVANFFYFSFIFLYFARVSARLFFLLISIYVLLFSLCECLLFILSEIFTNQEKLNCKNNIRKFYIVSFLTMGS
jgi:hypothetical protein